MSPQIAEEMTSTVLAAYEKLEEAMAEGRPKAEVDRLALALERARDRADIRERVNETKESIESKLARAKITAAQKATALKGAKAAASMRDSRHFAMTIAYKGIKISAYPAKAPDQTIRMTVLNTFRAASHFLAQVAEQDVHNARLEATGHQPGEQWTTQGLMLRLADDLRVGIREDCISLDRGSE